MIYRRPFNFWIPRPKFIGTAAAAGGFPYTQVIIV